MKHSNISINREKQIEVFFSHTIQILPSKKNKSKEKIKTSKNI